MKNKFDASGNMCKVCYSGFYREEDGRGKVEGRVEFVYCSLCNDKQVRYTCSDMEEQYKMLLEDIRIKFVKMCFKISHEDSLKQLHQLLIDMMNRHEQHETEEPIIKAEKIIDEYIKGKNAL